MKKIFTLFLTAISTVAFAGSLSCLEGTEVVSYVADTTYEAIVHLEIENTTSTALDVHCSRDVQESIDGSQNYFCWTQCYLPNADVSATPTTISGNSSVDIFQAHVKLLGNQGVFRAVYSFYDENDPTDKVDVTVIVYSTPVGIIENSFGNEIQRMFPNPATNYSMVNYKVDADQASEIVIYNMLGAKVEEIELLEEEGMIKIDTYKYNDGVYFVNLVSDDKVVSTQKLVVTK